MEIARSQVNQGPRGCSVARRSKDRRNLALKTLSHCCRTMEGLCTQPGPGCSRANEGKRRRQQHLFCSEKEGRDSKKGH